MHQLAEPISSAPRPASEVYPLENGDRLTAEEFLKRYAATPGIRKAELLDGEVYIETYYSTHDGCGFALQNGDHLTAEEFLKRYEATAGIHKAELIDGMVYIVAPPVSHSEHSAPHFNFATVLGVYSASTPGTSGGDNGTVRFDAQNTPQPDLTLIVLPSHGGRTTVGPDKFLTGPPELIVEIAGSSANVDLHRKRDLYARSGALEYIVWRTREKAIDYLILREGKYVPSSSTDGIFKSEVFPGLWIDSAALLAGDLAKALATTQKGIESPEHADFVTVLQQRASIAKQ
jgi:Uma2 family endonuclease